MILLRNFESLNFKIDLFKYNIVPFHYITDMSGSSVIDITKEYKQHQVNDLTYHSTTVDMDFIGWKYLLPTSNDIVVPVSDFFKYYSDSDSYHYSPSKPRFDIKNWNNFHESPICYSYFHNILIFPENTKISNIIKCIQHYIIHYPRPEKLNNYDMRPNWDLQFDEMCKAFGEHISKFKGTFTVQENLDYNSVICVNPDTLTIENYNIAE